MRTIALRRVPERCGIKSRGDVTDDRLEHLVEVAHRECFIANSVTTDITIEPRFVRVP
jgi:organic hydroperoxide reductase OsmC/OhrA